MKKHIALLMLIVMAVTLLASSAASAQSNPAGAGTAAAASGGHYRLTVDTWQVNGSARGGGYQLQGPARLTLASGNGCCCAFLPCIRKP